MLQAAVLPWSPQQERGEKWEGRQAGASKGEKERGAGTGLGAKVEEK